MSLLGDWDEIFEKDLRKLDEFHEVDRVDEIVSILKSLRHDEFFKDLANLHNGDKNSVLDSRDKWVFKFEEIPFFNFAKKELSSRSPVHLPPLTKFVSCTDFLALYAMLELSYVYDTKHKITDEELKSFFLGDIGQRITFYVENFDEHIDLPEISVDFFKRLKNVYWENKKTKKLNNKIYDVLIDIAAENWGPSVFNRTLIHCVFYLEACNALKYDRDIVTCDDVVVGFLTIFKILMSDIRLLV